MVAFNCCSCSTCIFYTIYNTFVLANISKILLRFVDEKVCYWISHLIIMMLCMVEYFIEKDITEICSIYLWRKIKW